MKMKTDAEPAVETTRGRKGPDALPDEPSTGSHPARGLRLKTGLRAGSRTRGGGDDDPGTIVIIDRDGP